MSKARSRIKAVQLKRTIKHGFAVVCTGFLTCFSIYSAVQMVGYRTSAAAPGHEPIYLDREVEIVREVEVDRTFTTEKQQIMAYIVEVFGDDAADAITVINKCENHAFNPKATNHNRNGSVDRGIFQLNSQYWGGEELYDWKTNVDVAYKVFTRAGKKWTPWTCSHTVNQKNYLGQ